MRKGINYAGGLKWLACAFLISQSVRIHGQTDQEITYGSYLGGLNFDVLRLVERSETGYWLIGNTNSINFPVTSDALYASPRGEDDITLTHVNSNLEEITYSTYWGGMGVDATNASTISNTGLLAIAGFTNSTNFPTEGLYSIDEKPGGLDGFITVFDTDSDVLWSSYFGGVGDDRILDISFDTDGNLYVVGTTNSPDMATPNAYLQNLQSSVMYSDAFICKFDPEGELIWFTYFGGEEGDGIGDVEIALDGRIFISGSTYSSGLATADAYQTLNNGEGDFIIGEIDTNGFPIWTTYYGGSELEGTIRMLLDDNAIFLTGLTASANLSGTQNGFQPDFGGELDLFLTQFDVDGNHLWSSYFGGSLLEPDCFNFRIEHDLFGNYVIASSTGSNSNIVFGSNPLDSQVPVNFAGKGFITKISAESNLPIWSTYLLDNCGLFDFVINDNNDIVGVTDLNDVDPSFLSPNGIQPTYGGGASDGAIIVIQDNVVTSTKERQSLDFQVFPNPTTGIVQIQSPQALDRVEIYDQLGRLVNESKSVGTQFELDVSALPSGIYLVRAGSGLMLGSSKIVKL